MKNINRYILSRKIAETILKENKLKIKVVSNSMYPTIKKGETVKIVGRKNIKIKSGDIILCSQYYGGTLIIHRCLLTIFIGDKKYYLTKGDFSIFVDPLVVNDRVLGKVILNEKNMLKLFYRKIQYIFLPIFVLLTLIYITIDKMKKYIKT